MCNIILNRLGNIPKSHEKFVKKKYAGYIIDNWKTRKSIIPIKNFY